MYEYRGSIVRVVDGDTVHVHLDLGINVAIDLTLRLYGINAPEMSTPEGVAAKAHLIELLQGGPGTTTNFQPLTIRTVKDRREKYGRYLGTLIRTADGLDVNQSMLSDGFAVVYP